MHSNLRSLTLVATKMHKDIREFCSVNMDMWFFFDNVVCDIME